MTLSKELGVPGIADVVNWIDVQIQRGLRESFQE